MFIEDEKLDAEALLDTTAAPPLPKQQFAGSLEEFINTKYPATPDQSSSVMYLAKRYAENRTRVSPDELKERAIFFDELCRDILQKDLIRASSKVSHSEFGFEIGFEIYNMAIAMISDYNLALKTKA